MLMQAVGLAPERGNTVSQSALTQQGPKEEPWEGKFPSVRWETEAGLGNRALFRKTGAWGTLGI